MNKNAFHTAEKPPLKCQCGTRNDSPANLDSADGDETDFSNFQLDVGPSKSRRNCLKIELLKVTHFAGNYPPTRLEQLCPLLS